MNHGIIWCILVLSVFLIPFFIVANLEEVTIASESKGKFSTNRIISET